MTTVAFQNNQLSSNNDQLFKSNIFSQIFKFDDQDIIVLGTIDKPLFIAKQICDILGYKNIFDALKDNIESHWKTKYKILTSEYPEIRNFSHYIFF
jgi:prophage antirepressor-like protein